MSSLRNWSKAGNSPNSSGTQLCPRCCLTSQPLCSAWGGSLDSPWSQWVFFPSIFNANPRNNPRKYSSASPCHVRVRHHSPGILWALNPILVAVLNYSQKCLNQKEKMFPMCCSLQHFPLVKWEKWSQVSIGSLNNLSVPTLVPALDLSLCH